MKRLVPVMLILANPAVPAENAETLAERSHAQARDVLERAVQAFGGRRRCAASR